MRFIPHIRRLGSILAALILPAMIFQAAALAETRLFVTDFKIGGGFDAQLLISNTTDRGTTVDIWAFLNKGKLLGQAQLRMAAHAIRSLTVGEVFGTQPDEGSGWLAAVSMSDGIQMSYHLLGQSAEPRDAESWPKRELALDIPQAGEYAVRVINASSLASNVTVRHKDATGRFLKLQELSIGPFQQLELPREALRDAVHVDVLADSDVLAAVVESNVKRRPRLESVVDDGTLSLVIDGNAPIGAYQVLLHFDPGAIQFSPDDILGGSADGFTSKPLAINIDNISGELRIASFQLGSTPQGSVDVAHIRLRPVQPLESGLGLNVEEITDLEGQSELNSITSVRLIRMN